MANKYPDRYNEQQEQANITGTVERVTFHSEETGFCVVRVKVKGVRDLITVVGQVPEIASGEFLEATGRWRNDPQYGLQLAADSLKLTAPTTVEGIQKYLASGLIKGIGAAYAERLVKAFGSEVFTVIENAPERLREVPGIGAKRCQQIVKGWDTQQKIKEIMLFLYANGVGTAKAVRIYKTYGDQAVALIKENPYRLAHDIYGIGFLTADAMAQKMGIAKDSLLRARAGVSYALFAQVDNGHCGFPAASLVPQAAELLDIPATIIEEAIQQELAAGQLRQDEIDGEVCLFIPSLYYYEKHIAQEVMRLMNGSVRWSGIEADKAISWVEQRLQLALADNQKQAVAAALHTKFFVITGGPGVGKTTIVNSIIKILEAKQLQILLTAPTGRAAKRMSESTGMEAKTIHRLLEFDPAERRFKRDSDNPLECDLLVVDETSMVDAQLMSSLLQAVPGEAAVILVGDVNQLPSVGAGQVLADIIDSGQVKVVILNEIFRQAKTSRIITNAHAINAGLMPNVDNDLAGDFFFVGAETAEDGIKKIVQIVKERVPKRWHYDSVRDVQVLCPANVGGIGAKQLNIELQKVLNPNAQEKIERFGITFATGDKVMQIQNNYDKEVFNGDIGFITQIDLENKEMAILFDEREVIYEFDELDEVVLAYACTIHKSQGSEYPVVVLPIMMQQFMMLQKNLVYTGVTRGKKLVIIVGQKKALHVALKGAKQNQRRYSKLKEWLNAFVI